MLISMVAVFGICWLPLNIINLLADLNFPVYCWEYHNFTFFVFHVMAMSSTCYNPFLYGRYNETFQTEFVKMIPALGHICGKPLNENAQNNPPNQHVQIQRKESVVFKGSAVELPRNGSAEIKLVPQNGTMESQKQVKTSATMV